MNLSTLNNSLFAQLERLGNPDLKGDELKEEVERSKSITAVSSQILDNAKIALQAHELQLEYGVKKDIPKMLDQQ
jgi:hypothetical protein